VGAQSLLAIDGLSGDMYSVDCHSGVGTLVRSQSWSLNLWTGLAQDSTGRLLLSSIPPNQFSICDLYEVDVATGQINFLTSVNRVGIASIAFGPNDVLFAAIDLSFPTHPQDYRLFTIDLATGATTEIGPLGLDFVITMDYDGTDMYVWSGFKGLAKVDLNTGLATDVNPGFVGNQDLSTSLCFGDNGALYTLDAGLWITDPNTGVESLVGSTVFPGLFDALEYIPGPASVLSLWLSDQVGKPTTIECRGATPGAQIAIFTARRPSGQMVIPAGMPCAGTVLDLNPASIQLATVTHADAQGSVSLGPGILPQRALYELQLQALDLNSCTTSNPISVWF